MTTFPEHFLWGAATAGHQIEGNNVNSDWWAREQLMPGMELSGDASTATTATRRHPLLADAGLTSTDSAWSGRASSRARTILTRRARPLPADDRHCLERGSPPS